MIPRLVCLLDRKTIMISTSFLHAFSSEGRATSFEALDVRSSSTQQIACTPPAPPAPLEPSWKSLHFRILDIRYADMNLKFAEEQLSNRGLAILCSQYPQKSRNYFPRTLSWKWMSCTSNSAIRFASASFASFSFDSSAWRHDLVFLSIPILPVYRPWHPLFSIYLSSIRTWISDSKSCLITIGFHHITTYIRSSRLIIDLPLRPPGHKLRLGLAISERLELLLTFGTHSYKPVSACFTWMLRYILNMHHM